MLKIGDTVRQKTVSQIFKMYGYQKNLENYVGVVHCFFKDEGTYVGVDFKSKGMYLHNLNNTLSEPTGRWYHVNELELIIREFNDDEWE